jgi:ribosomal-protein-alanine N-acetyltransferase
MAKGEELVCFAILKGTKEFVGTVGLHRVNTATPELGCWVKRPAHGNKYGREAIHGLKKWAV